MCDQSGCYYIIASELVVEGAEFIGMPIYFPRPGHYYWWYALHDDTTEARSLSFRESTMSVDVDKSVSMWTRDKSVNGIVSTHSCFILGEELRELSSVYKDHCLLDTCVLTGYDYDIVIPSFDPYEIEKSYVTLVLSICANVISFMDWICRPSYTWDDGVY